MQPDHTLTLPLAPGRDARRALLQARAGLQDPRFREVGDQVWLTARLPTGPASAAVSLAPGRATAQLWGPGAEQLAADLPGRLGQADQPAGFAATGPLLRWVARVPGFVLGRTSRISETLWHAILEQRVETRDAFRSYAALIRALGEPAPGPAPDDLWVAPSPADLLACGLDRLHAFGVEASRGRTLLQAASRARRLEEAAQMDPEDADRRLQALPGIGPWTSARTLLVACGAPDLVPLGDLHLPHTVVYAFTGRPRGTEAEMLDLLAPYAGQRGRVVSLLLEAGASAPRRSPRPAPSPLRRGH